MAVTIKRGCFVGTWLSDAEHRAVVEAARAADVSLAAYLRQAVVREAGRLARRRHDAEAAALGLLHDYRRDITAERGARGYTPGRARNLLPFLGAPSRSFPANTLLLPGTRGERSRSRCVSWSYLLRRIVRGTAAQNPTEKRPERFPFAGTDQSELLLLQWKIRQGLFVFHRGGRRIKDFRAAWDAASTRAGLDGMLVHDLRRTAAREYQRQGVSEGAIMALCGWKTRSMFDATTSST